MKQLLKYLLLSQYYRNGQIMFKNIVNVKELSIYKDGIYERWNKLGFTQGLDEHDSIILSNAFEDMAQYLLTQEDDVDNVVCYPILRRLYTKYNIILIPSQLAYLIKKALPILKKEFKDEGSYDPLAYACGELTDMIGRHFKKKIYK